MNEKNLKKLNEKGLKINLKECQKLDEILEEMKNVHPSFSKLHFFN